MSGISWNALAGPQGKRLQDLLWQLDDALHGAPPMTVSGTPHPMAGAAAAGTADFSASAHSSPSLSPFGSHGPLMPPFRALSDPSPAVQELLQLPQRPAAALPAPSTPSSSSPPSSISAPASHGHDTADPHHVHSTAGSPASNPDPRPVTPGVVTMGLDRAAAAAAAENETLGSTLSPGGPAFTLRQFRPHAGQSPTAGAAPSGSTGGSYPPHGGVLGAGLTDPPVAYPSAGRPGGGGGQAGAAMATIDVDVLDGEVEHARVLAERRRASGAAADGGGGAATAGPAGAMRGTAAGGSAGAGGLGSVGSIPTNVVSTLMGILTAAMKMAAVSGIAFIVNAPLATVLPRRAARAPQPTSSSSSLRKHQQGTNAGSAGSAGTASADSEAPPQLIPRPARPLLVGVRAALVQRVVGYMLDIALQCTPRGGQVCVSARQDGTGVQLVLLHTGRMDLQRLHVRSRGLSAPAAPPPHATTASMAPAGVAAVAGAGTGAIARPHRAVAHAPSAGVQGRYPSTGSVPGPGVLCVEMAQELAQQAGGHLTVSYPCQMVNARSGSLDLGTSVEIWLPGPGAGAAAVGAGAS